MSSYEVFVPIVGYYSVVVKAGSESEAIDHAMQKDFHIDFQSEECDLCEIDVVRHVTRGNVCRAPLNEAEAKEL